MNIEPLGRMLMVGLLGVLALGADSSAQCNYDVTVLDYPIICGISSVNTRGRGMNEQGAVAKAYKIFRCWVSEYTALPEMDANGNGVAIESMVLQNEGWERDEAVTEPTET